MAIIEKAVILLAILFVSGFVYEFMKWIFSMMGFPIKFPFILVFVLITWFVILFNGTGKTSGYH